VKKHPKSLYEALFSLQHIRKPGRVGSPFDNLTISTLKGWFEKDVTGRFVLRRKYEEAIASYGCCCSFGSYSTRVKKEEEIIITQEHKKPTSKRNPRNSKPRKICYFQH